MKRHYLILIALASINLTIEAQNNINRYEFWFDNNFEGRTSVGITPLTTFQLVSNIPTIGLNEGMHSFHIRFKDKSAIYSQPLSQFFLKIPASSVTNRKIIAYEYWYDNNYAGKVTQSVIPQSTANMIDGISAVALGDGLHSFNIRFKDDQHMWSSVQSQFFHKIATGTTANKNIVAYEYWYDNNYAGRVTQTLAPQTSLQLVTNISASTLSEGLHLFHIRFKDDRKTWSSVQSQFFQKISNSGTLTNQLLVYRYWFDGNITSLRNVNISPPSNSSQLTATISTPILSTGDHTINFQFKDIAGRWSCATADTFSVAFARGGAITGMFTYNNTPGIPLDSVWAVLKMNGIKVDSVRTDLAGSFMFEPTLNGTYTLNPTTDKPWSGVNATDAIKIQRHYAGLEYLTTPVSMLAADVNLSNSVNATDAINVKRRFSGLDPTFTRGDWTFANPTGGDTIVINGSDVTQDFQGLCVGDVNGSGIPAQSVTITHYGEIKVNPEQEFELPIRISLAQMVNAISLVIPYPADLLEFMDVKTSAGTPVFTTADGTIRIAWSELLSLNLLQGDTLILLKFKTTNKFKSDFTIDLMAIDESELADETGNVISYAELFTQTIKTINTTGNGDPKSILKQCTLFPNPASDVLNIELLTNQNANLSMEITDMLGRVKVMKTMGELTEGVNTFRIGISNLVNGVYTIRLNLDGEKGKNSFLYKVVISK
ncbi:MAG: T9SS type A sorting domain-containing protein [Bacteroidales bacterium]|nr:T9SS type A sorting domain-containing protein [Bacteroidales bacterium]